MTHPPPKHQRTLKYLHKAIPVLDVCKVIQGYCIPPPWTDSKYWYTRFARLNERADDTFAYLTRTYKGNVSSIGWWLVRPRALMAHYFKNVKIRQPKLILKSLPIMKYSDYAQFKEIIHMIYLFYRDFNKVRYLVNDPIFQELKNAHRIYVDERCNHESLRSEV